MSSAGFYEVDNKPDDATLSIRLFDFSRGQVPPRQLVDERLIKGIQVGKEEQYLQVQLSLTTSQYHYRAHLFKSPPMLVIDIKSQHVVSEKKAAAAIKIKNSDKQPEIAEPKPRPKPAGNVVAKSLTVIEPESPAKPETAASEKAVPSEPQSLSPAEKELSTDKPMARKSASESPVEKAVPTPAAEFGIDPGRELYEQGLQHYFDSELKEAMETFNRLVTLFPHSDLVPKALFRYSDALARQESSKGSQNLHHLIDSYLEAVRKYSRDSDAPWALLQVGRFYESMGFHYEAEGVYQTLVHQYPRSSFAAVAWYESARINYALKRYRKALHEYEQLVKKYPERGFSAEAEFYQANCLYHLGDFSKALTRYQSALKRTPEYLQTDPRTIYLLGSCYLSLKKYQQARDYLLMMRNLFPEHKLTSVALAKVGDSFLTQGKFTEGVASLATVIKEYPGTDSEILARLAMARLGSENPDLAGIPELRPYAGFLDSQQAYRLIIDNYPDNPLSNVARLRLGRLLHKQHDYAGARQLFDQLISPQVDHDIRSVSLAEMRKVIYDELRDDYQQKKYAAMVALQERYGNTFLSRPTGMYPFFWLAEALYHQGLYAGALKLYGLLQGFKPSKEEFLAITWWMARCHLSLGQVKEATGLLEPLVMDDLENSWWVKIMMLKAELMVRKGKNAAALKMMAEIRSRLPAGQIPERVSLMTMMGKAYNDEGKIDAAIASYREAIFLANAQPQMVDVTHRVNLTSALARTLFVKGDYQESLTRFRQASLMMNRHENLAELLYWQSLCHARLGQKKELDKVISTLKSRYKNSDWTSLAISNFKDYQWKTGNRNLQ